MTKMEKNETNLTNEQISTSSMPSEQTKKSLANFLGLAVRAGKTITGEELVVKSIQNGKAKLVFLASDASSNTQKKITDKSNFYEVKLTTIFSQNELSSAIGSDRKVLAVLDRGFSQKMEKIMK